MNFGSFIIRLEILYLNDMKTKYLLIEWPESQKWIDHPDCYLAAENDELRQFFTPTYFVPENIYNLSKQRLELENTEFDYGHNVNHKVEE